MSDIIYPPCKGCGASHTMGMTSHDNGERIPIDACYNCILTGKLKPIVKDKRVEGFE